MKKYSLVIILIFTLGQVLQASKTLVNAGDFLHLYNPSTAINQLEEEKMYWENRIKKAPNQYSYLEKLAGVNEQLFKITGDIDALKNAESQRRKVLKEFEINKSGQYRSMALNLITQHRFCAALEMLEMAYALGEKKQATIKMLHDVQMELGNYELAFYYLNRIEKRNAFDYLIRKAKWEDYTGNLDAAIVDLEQAKRIANAAKNTKQLSWIYSNLGDFYGHAGMIEESYRHFIQTLRYDATESHALKGIAWIGYSRDGDSEKALKLLNMIQNYNETPDYHLLKAEIWEYQGKENKAKQAKELFMSKTEVPEYGCMYDHPRSEIFCQEMKNFDAAKRLAQKEIDHRATPQSYDLMSWVLYRSGETEQARQIASDHVWEKTGEPKVLVHLQEIFAEHDPRRAAIKEELKEAAFEIGPLSYQEIFR